MVLVDGHEFLTEEEKRLKEDRNRIKTGGKPWTYFSHGNSRKQVYRWGEDGIAGVCDSHGYLNIAFSFWNGKDEILKERLFGTSLSERNHNGSIKEAHFHLDNVPTHSYMKYLYKYPQRAFPYQKLEACQKTKEEREFSLFDTGVFENGAYWDIVLEFAKGADDPEELHFRATAWNRGTERAPLHIIPQAWFRNTWAWRQDDPPTGEHPSIEKTGESIARIHHELLGERHLVLSPSPGTANSGEDVIPQMLFTENESNLEALGLGANKVPHVKDAFHRYIIDNDLKATNPTHKGTKSAAWYAFDEDGGVLPGECAVVRFKLIRQNEEYLDEELFDDVVAQRMSEADEFYYYISPLPMSEDLRNIQRQAFAGLLWCKQYSNFNWEQWLKGDPTMPPFARRNIRNERGKHIHWDDVLSVRDSWEYPFINPWDLAFGSVVMAMIDPDFAKHQLDLVTRENYMQPSGQIPSNDCSSLDEVDPPVLAWAVFRVFKIERKMYGRQDLDFLESVFQKLMLNFTWWVNRKDTEGKNIFEGGFLGLDNISPFNRSAPLPTGGVGVLEQADGTGWMAFYCLTMLNIALELAKSRPIYERLAAKFFEHFILISDAMRNLWNDTDGFYYDAISWGGGWNRQLRVRSLVGIIPLFATLTVESEMLDRFSYFKRRVDWFMKNRTDIAERNIASFSKRGKGNRLLCALVSRDRLEKLLKRILSEDEFLADHGIRSLSKAHGAHPYCVTSHGKQFTVAYQPGESDGNTNWRGPVWMTVNFLLIESLQRFFLFYGEGTKVECPTDSGDYMHLGHIAEELQHRLQHLFARTDDGRRSINAGNDILDFDEHWKDHLFFHEYFDGDTGRGLGASHHCGSSSLIARMIHDTGITCRLPQTPRTSSVGLSIYFDDILGKHAQSAAQSLNPSRLASAVSSRRPTDGNYVGQDDFFEQDELVKQDDLVQQEKQANYAKKAEANAHLFDVVTEQLKKLQVGHDLVDLEAEIEA
ncbi:Six-hairpin glycosidase-like protein [Xylaria longipes]|nr:Six-hairpin glycosidase-like protein [Xylaria longipes]